MESDSKHVVYGQHANSMSYVETDIYCKVTLSAKCPTCAKDMDFLSGKMYTPLGYTPVNGFIFCNECGDKHQFNGIGIKEALLLPLSDMPLMLNHEVSITRAIVSKRLELGI